MEFKRKRNDNLIEFRKMISGFESKLSGASSTSELKALWSVLKKSLQKKQMIWLQSLTIQRLSMH
ncbi:hypothetical protein [Macellibacteroides fermentans]|uniref:hypothetical protein n=1 Tax=Macellibacteroides fermentans TaxID=879969 RepID=UPI0037432882